jgi:arylsulfatase A-like enzyme
MTPNIDRLASEGLRFETFWVSSICTPTRCKLLTGRYAFRTGWVKHHDAPRYGGQYFDWNREVTFARPVRDAGYKTVIGGKWQINDFRIHPDALDKHGFDEHCVWTGYESGNPPSGNRYTDPYLITNGERQTHAGQYGPKIVNDFLIDFVGRHKEQPFLIYYPMMLAHGGPNSKPPEGFFDAIDHLEEGAKMVPIADWLVGRLVKAVDDNGLADNTLILFTGDNGSGGGAAAWGRDREQNKAKGNSGNIGCHTPLIARWRGAIAPGLVTPALSDATDMLPTFVELANGKLPEGVTLDGHSIVPILKGKSQGKREWIYSQGGEKRKVRDQRYILHFDGTFFDLEADFFEEKDLSKSTDAATVAARERLQAVLSSFPADKSLDGFPPRYSKATGVPALPAGSGKWKPWDPKAEKRENKARKGAKKKEK